MRKLVGKSKTCRAPDGPNPKPRYNSNLLFLPSRKRWSRANFDLLQRIFGHRNNVSRAVLDEVNALTLITKRLRKIEFQPPVVLALSNILWWSTSSFVVRDVPCCRLTLRNNERVIDHDEASCDATCPQLSDDADHGTKRSALRRGARTK